MSDQWLRTQSIWYHFTHVDAAAAAAADDDNDDNDDAVIHTRHSAAPRERRCRHTGNQWTVEHVCARRAMRSERPATQLFSRTITTKRCYFSRWFFCRFHLIQARQLCIWHHQKNHQLYYSKTERYQVQQMTRRTALYTSWHASQAQPTAGFSTGK